MAICVCWCTPSLSGDLAVENDSLAIDFSIYVNYDIQVESFFEPVAGTRYELNKDKVSPTVRMVNFGSRDQSNIRVTSRIRQDTNIAKEQTQTISLLGRRKSNPCLRFCYYTFCW